MSVASDPTAHGGGDPAADDLARAEVVAAAEVADRIAGLYREAREARAQLDAVLASVPAIIWRWEPDRGCTFVSDAWMSVLGRNPAEALGSGWADSVHPADRDGFLERCLKAMQRGEAFAAEYRLRKADGTYVSVNDQGRPMAEEVDRGGFVGAALDVTSQRDAETKVRAANALLSGAAEGMGVGLAVKDLEGRYVLVNDVMSEAVGAPVADMIGRTDRELHRDGWDSLEEEDRLVMVSGEIRRAERDVRTQGGVRSYLLATSPLRAADGRIDGVIVASADVTPERLRRDRAERLERLARTLAGSSTTDEVADAVLGGVLDTLAAPYGALGLPTPDGRSLSLERQRGFDAKADLWRGLAIDGDSPQALAFRESRSGFYPDARAFLERFPSLEGRIQPFEARATLPLRGRSGSLGVLYVAFDEPRVFDPEEVAFFDAVADLIASALERAMLADAAARSAAEIRVLLDVAAELSRAVNTGDVRRVAVELAKKAVNADACLVGMIDRRTGRLTYPDSGGYPPELARLLPTSLEPGASPAADAVLTGEMFSFDSSEEMLVRYPNLGPLTEQLPYRSRIFVPIVGSAEPIGMMVASSIEPARFGEAERSLLQAVGRQCGQSLERAAFYRDARASATRAAKIQAASEHLAAATTTSRVADAIMESGLSLANTSVGGLALLDRADGTLVASRWVGVPEALVQRWAEVPLTTSRAETEVARSLRPTISSVGSLRERDPLLADDVATLGLAAVVVVPLVSGATVLGVIGLGLGPGVVLAEGDVELLEAFGERAGAALQRTHLLEAEARTRQELEATLSRLSRLQSVTTSLSTAVRVDDVAQTVLEETIAALGGSGGAVYVAEEGVLREVATAGIAIGSPYDGSHSVLAMDSRVALAEAFRTGHVVWSPTTAEWRDRYPEGQAMFEGRARSTIAVPFVLEDRILGSMSILFEEEQGLTKAERRLARTIGEQAGQALERARLYEAELARGQRMRRLQEVTAQLVASNHPDEVSRVLVSSGVKASGAQAGVVALVADDGTVELAASSGFPDALLEAFKVTPISAQLPGNDVIRSRLPSFLRSPEEIARRYPDLDPEGPHLREAAWATLPLLVRGRAIGAVHFSFAEPQAFDAEQIGGLASIVTDAAQAMNRAQQFAREREVSEVLQENLLAKDVISAWRGTDVVTRYWAGAENLEVGGDWFDVIELPNGRLGVSVGDVVGRGLRAAAAMGQLRSALRGLALDGRGPSATLEGLDRFACSTPGTELATVVYGELDPASGVFAYACAGHPPPVASIGGRTRVLDQGRSPLLAAGFDGPRPSATCRLSPGATVILYTDGLVERRGESFDVGVQRLVRSLENAAETDLEDLSDAITRDLIPGSEQDDDVAFLCLRVGQPGAVFASAFDADPAELAGLRRSLRDWLASLSVEAADIDAVVLAVNEAAANSIEHGYQGERSGEVETRARWSNGELVVEIRDTGSWLERAPDPARGRGIAMMRKMMDSVEIEPRDGGTAVHLRRRLDVADAGIAR